MEQRIGSSSQPLEGAGFDPAFIPGLTSPVTAEPEDTRPAEDDGVDAVEPEAGKGESAAPERPDASAEPDPADRSDGSDGSEEPDESAESVEGPVFEASDRRARIAADAKGVRLRLDEESCEFRWDEIGAVETETPRFGKRFTITVHTPDRRWYPIEIEATARSRFKEWEEQLDAVLDAYFEDGEAEAEAGADEEAVEVDAATGADAANGDADAEDTGTKAAEAEDDEVKDAGAKAAD
ncbi:hypothetical protein G9272_28670 [Streptomyces asoensis]|uniref:Uncharacterized protein n=1 Tax=Streptomyces asoensis TaxID=249586 RepID=A0A6M4X0I6_9ACTN|nr:hypothetical protein [Streptomyces asoensis]QJT03766.1 hypothetical protein G9272_28670 [Streptomyces asoensis]